MPDSDKTKKNRVAIPESVHDWLDSDQPSPREFIVVADLPKRTVEMERPSKGVPRFTSIRGPQSAERDERLAELLVKIHSIVPCDQAKTLKAAGAIAVRALPEHIREIALLPAVREIQMNVRRK